MTQIPTEIKKAMNNWKKTFEKHGLVPMPEVGGDRPTGAEQAHLKERKRYNVCEQCGNNCSKKRNFCFKCTRKRLRLEMAELAFGKKN